MKRIASRRGFTLVEMLVVIAIIAVLVAVVIPTVSSATKKSKAAADASNLRSVLGQVNVLLLSGAEQEAIKPMVRNVPPCKTFPEAHMVIVDDFPAFVDIFYYVDNTHCYGKDYFSTVAETGSYDGPDPIRPTAGHYAEAAWIDLTEGGVMDAPAAPNPQPEPTVLDQTEPEPPVPQQSEPSEPRQKSLGERIQEWLDFFKFPWW